MQDESLDKKSILSIFSEYKTSLTRFARRYVNRDSDLEDILQEAFVKTFVADKQRNITFPKVYLFKTTKNLAIRENTKMATRLTDYIEDSNDSLLLSNENDGFKHLSEHEEQTLLLAALDSLPVQCQRVTRLRLLEGVRIKDIAKQLNIAISTTEKHLAKGIERCDAYISNHCFQDSKHQNQNITMLHSKKSK
ncbi:MAG: RNA polymerase sigma factor [Aliiglaciecola sp.]|uniref:RNA polymerase sigma factor n=1 Tax=Aliiglaciecola sp. TaxID=1872441 RepID=UPI003298AAB4